MNDTRTPLLDEYRKHLTAIGKSAHTVKAYLHDLSSFATWFEGTTGGGFDPKAVDPKDITEYRGFVLRNGGQPATVNRRLIALRRFFAWAVKKGYATSSPFEVLEAVRVKQQKDIAPRWLTHQEQLALLRAVRRSGNVRDLAILQTLLGTGLRISELADLQVSDLEMNERSGWVTVRQGKGTKNRKVPLSNQTRQVLSAYLAEREEDDSSRLFLGQRGPLSEWGSPRAGPEIRLPGAPRGLHGSHPATYLCQEPGRRRHTARSGRNLTGS